MAAMRQIDSRPPAGYSVTQSHCDTGLADDPSMNDQLPILPLYLSLNFQCLKYVKNFLKRMPGINTYS